MSNTKADIHANGMTKRRSILGDAHVDRAESNKTGFDENFQEFITRYAWGEVWQGDSLSTRDRHLITLAMMAALGKEQEFSMHVRATKQTGVTQAELADILKTVAIYAGLPAANTAFGLAKKVYAEGEL